MHMELDYLAPAQCMGYVVFVLGVAAFLQKSDAKLKSLNACESLASVVHFSLMNSPPSAVSCALAALRSFLAVKIHSAKLATIFICANLGFGLCVLNSLPGLLPIVGSCAATWAVFMMKDVPMRLVFLFGTACWLANDIIIGSIGGTVLETFIGISNAYTIVRMIAANKKTPDGVNHPGLEMR